MVWLDFFPRMVRSIVYYNNSVISKFRHNIFKSLFQRISIHFRIFDDLMMGCNLYPKGLWDLDSTFYSSLSRHWSIYLLLYLSNLLITCSRHFFPFFLDLWVTQRLDLLLGQRTASTAQNRRWSMGRVRRHQIDTIESRIRQFQKPWRCDGLGSRHGRLQRHLRGEIPAVENSTQIPETLIWCIPCCFSLYLIWLYNLEL